MPSVIKSGNILIVNESELLICVIFFGFDFNNLFSEGGSAFWTTYSNQYTCGCGFGQLTVASTRVRVVLDNLQ